MSQINEIFIQEPARKIPVYQKVDVAIVGGGPAGFAAAVSAGRGGANALLIERNAVLGGTVTTSFIPEFHCAENFGGIYKEVVQRLGELGGAAKDAVPEYFAIAFDPEVMKFVMTDLVEESGAKLLRNTWVVDAIMEGKKIKGVIIENKSGRQAVLADVVIDASGDADVALKAGVPMQEYTTPQPMMMIFRMGGIDYQKIEEYSKSNPDNFRPGWRVLPGESFDGVKIMHIAGWFSVISDAKANGDLPKNFGNNFSVFGISPSALEHSIGYLYAAKVLKKDPYNADDMNRAESEGRKGVREFLPFLKKVPGFESAFLIDVALNIGVRDSRRIVGDYTLCREDLFQCRSFEDDIALYLHRGPNIEGWVMHPPDGRESSAEHLASIRKAPQSLIVFGIPYRCLLPQGVEQLLVAGKTISMSYEAHTRCRQIPACLSFGQAAGAAAAMAVRDKISPRHVNIARLRNTLAGQGVNLKKEQINAAKVKAYWMGVGLKFEE